MRTFRCSMALGAYALAGTACGTGDAGGVGVEVRDSAGIEIVENTVGDAAIPRWRLSEAPRVSIGVVEGAEEAYRLDAVRGAMLDDDRIIVLNAGSGELRFFDLQGRHVHSVGRKGDGPGEIRSGYWLGPHRGDSLAVYDIIGRRVSIFDGDGRFGRSYSAAGFGSGIIAGRLDDGSFVVKPAIFIGRPQDARPGIVRDQLPIVRLPDGGEPLDTIAMSSGYEVTREVVGPPGAERVNLRLRPFPLSTSVAARDSLIYAGDGDTWAIEVLDRTGTVRRSIRRAMERPLVTDEHKGRYREDRLATVTDENRRRDIERTIASASFPERLPPYGNFRVDDLGNLWVQDYRVGLDDPEWWTIFDSGGRAIGRLSLPPRFQVYQSGADFILGRTQDDLDVERIVLYGLERPADRSETR